jgi:hypothetical protein
MRRGFDQLCELKDEGIDYLRLRWASLRLDAVDKISGSLSKAFGYAIALFLVFFALVFLMIALALWVGEELGCPALGFLIAGGGFLIGGMIMFFVGKDMINNTLVRYFIDMFFTEKEQ